MSLIQKEFEYRECEVYGGMGWVEKDAPKEYVCGMGMIVAHGVLEHVDTEYRKDSWEDELLALGAMTFIRGRNYFVNKMYPDVSDQMSGDLTRCFQRMASLDRDIRLHQFVEQIDDDEVDNELVRAISLAVDECNEYGGDRPSRINQERMLHILRDGHNRAKKRFDGDEQTAVSMFIDIESQVNDFKYADETTVMDIEANPDDGRVSVIFRENEYEY